MTLYTDKFPLRYVGPRFEGHRLPLDVLPDLSAFRDLLVSFMKVQWKATHEDRVRLPKGFERSIAFDLAGVTEGSAVPLLEWNREVAQFLLPEFKDELQTLIVHAYEKVLNLIDGANDNVSTAGLPPAAIRALNRFGSGLLGNERIEFPGSEDKNGNVVYLDRARRKLLITRGRDSYETLFENTGKLLGSEKYADGRSGLIKVETEQYGTIDIPVHAERVKEEFDGSMDGDVQFRLMIELDNKDVFKRVVDVFDVDLIDAAMVANLERCRERILALSTLEEGWNDGDGEAVTPTAIAAASQLLSARPLLAGSYHIYPTEIGGVLFEFVHSGWDYSIEVTPTGGIEIYGVEIEGPKDLDTKEFATIAEDTLNLLDSLIGSAQ